MSGSTASAARSSLATSSAYLMGVVQETVRPEHVSLWLLELHDV